MTLWLEIALLAALYLALWAWLTWKLQTWFEREIWAARGPHEEVVPAERARSAPARRHNVAGSMTHEQAWKRLPDLLDEPDQPILLHHVKHCHACQRQLFLLGRVDRLLRDVAGERSWRQGQAAPAVARTSRQPASSQPCSRGASSCYRRSNASRRSRRRSRCVAALGGEPQDYLERAVGAGPMFSEDVLVAAAHKVAQDERGDDHVVELADHGDEVGDEVEG